MKVKVVDKKEIDSEMTITKDELKTLHSHFYPYNIEVDDSTALSILDELIYYDIKKWDIDDTGVREQLSERTSELLMGKYRGKYQGFPQEDWRKTVDEVSIVAELNGFKRHSDSANKEYKIPQEFIEEIKNRYNDQKKNNFEFDPVNSPGLLFVGSMGSGKSVTDSSHPQYEGFRFKEKSRDGFFRKLLIIKERKIKRK